MLFLTPKCSVHDSFFFFVLLKLFFFLRERYFNGVSKYGPDINGCCVNIGMGCLLEVILGSWYYIGVVSFIIFGIITLFRKQLNCTCERIQ